MSWNKFATHKDLGGPSIGGPTFAPARVMGAALFGEDMDAEALALFKELSGGIQTPNPDGYRELWAIAGRRSSKSLTIATIAAYAATVGAETFPGRRIFNCP